MMKIEEFVRKSIEDRSVDRGLMNSYKELENYFHFLMEVLKIDDLQILSVNTIEKRVYEAEVSGSHLLVFDHYILENFLMLNSLIMKGNNEQLLNSYFNKTMSEEFFVNNQYGGAIHYAGQYMNTLDAVIESYKGDYSAGIKNYLFTQQAFIISHEVFHYFFDKNEDLKMLGIEKKRKALLESLKNGEEERAFTQNENLMEELLCDSNAVIQCVSFLSPKEMNIVDVSLGCVLAILNQFTLTTIQEYVKWNGGVNYTYSLRLFSYRILHFLAFTRIYLYEDCSSENALRFEKESKEIYDRWLCSVQIPILQKVSRTSSIYFSGEMGEVIRREDVFQTLLAIYRS